MSARPVEGDIGQDCNYSEDYRHFDNLIWQVPNWATATFALTATAASVAAVNGKAFAAVTGLQIKPFIGLFLLIVAVVLTLLSNVLFRFRVHQATIRIRASCFVRQYRWLPAGHTSIQAILSLEASALYVACLVCFEVPLPFAIAIPTLAALLATWWIDREIKNIKGSALANPPT
ncbi:MAG TPA: hypothetical protein VFP12_01095 [Allosphingosinicella sp.]|nr:hypothetical protein [Allosphingosinicella sp.]